MLQSARFAAGLLLAGWAAGFAARAADGGTNAEVVNYSYEVVHTYPHDRGAYTQGLVFLNGNLLESAGQYKLSNLRETELLTGKILREEKLSDAYFAEGLALLEGRLYQLTWQEHKAFVYDLKTFKQTTNFDYTGEGWGLTTDGHWLIMSDGSNDLRFLDPATFKVDHSVNVTKDGAPVNLLNALEYVKGEIFANVYTKDFIVRMDPATGRVTGVVNFDHLLPLADADRLRPGEVLNGIAYDAAGDRLFVTGKDWPKLFEVRLKPLPPRK